MFLVCLTLSSLCITVFLLYCSEPSQVHQQPVDAVVRPPLIQKFCYKLLSVVTFTFIQTFDQNFDFFTEQRRVDRQCDFKNVRHFWCAV